MNELLLAKFKQTEEKYKELKDKLTQGLVTTEQMKSELMRMMVQDETGKYWMLGGKTGKWYIHNGTTWQEAEPYQKITPEPSPVIMPVETIEKQEKINIFEEKPIEKTFSPLEKESTINAEPVHFQLHPASELRQETHTESAGYQSSYQSHHPVTPPVSRTLHVDKEETEEVEDEEIKHPASSGRGEKLTPCRVCQSRIPVYAEFCSFCGANQKYSEEKTIHSPSINIGERKDEIVLKYVSYLSLMFFMGGVGIIFGVVFGAFFGIFKTFLTDFSTYYLPLMLSETRGKLQGALIFGALGGVGGFIVSALFSFVLSLFYNMISFVFGGIRFKVKY